jgi:hypothetical protein
VHIRNVHIAGQQQPCLKDWLIAHNLE